MNFQKKAFISFKKLHFRRISMFVVFADAALYHERRRFRT